MSAKGVWKNDEHRPFTPLPKWFHCSRIVGQENWNRIPCMEEAVLVYEVEPGYRIGFCARHRADGQKHAEYRGWTVAA